MDAVPADKIFKILLKRELDINGSKALSLNDRWIIDNSCVNRIINLFLNCLNRKEFKQYQKNNDFKSLVKGYMNERISGNKSVTKRIDNSNKKNGNNTSHNECS